MPPPRILHLFPSTNYIYDAHPERRFSWPFGLRSSSWLSSSSARRKRRKRQPCKPIIQKQQNILPSKQWKVYGCWTKNRGIWKPPKWMVKIMEHPMNKWMIWGYHYFWKHPYFQWRKFALNVQSQPNKLSICPNGIIFHQPRFPWNSRVYFPSKTLVFGGPKNVFSVAKITCSHVHRTLQRSGHNFLQGVSPVSTCGFF